MKTSRSSSFWLSRVLLRVRAAGWPVWLGVGAGVTGLLMLVAVPYVAQQARQLAQASQVASAKPASGQPAVDSALASTEFASSLPAQRTHLDDLDRLFKLAIDSGVSVGSIVYRSEGSSATPVLIRTLDLRLNEDYPRLKGFVAALLASMPHAALQEIRVERKDTAIVQQQVLLKLSFFYQSEAKALAPAPAATGAGTAGADAGAGRTAGSTAPVEARGSIP